MDYHMAIYLSRDVKRYIEELEDKRRENVPGICELARELEARLSMELEQMISELERLERSIETQDDESIIICENLIDAMVDFLNARIDAAERNESRHRHGMRIQELKAWRESTGKLAQLLCQSIE